MFFRYTATMSIVALPAREAEAAEATVKGAR